MADNHRALRVPAPLWKRFDVVAGDQGRTGDLRSYIDWQNDNPDVVLGPDADPPYDFLATLRIDQERWDAFLATVGEGAASARLRGYIRWRVAHPRRVLRRMASCV